MIQMTTLTTALLELTHEIGKGDLRLIVGGGFGIYLKYREIRRSHPKTLLGQWPEPRSTNDLDLFLRTELLVDSQRLIPLVIALETLGYHAVEKYYQFAKPGPGGRETGGLKIDLLAGPRQILQAHGIVAQERRAYPKPKIPLHAHPVDEALTLEEHLQPIIIGGHLSNGTPAQAEVFLPHSFTYILMKCFALRDRINDAEKDYGRHHALDLYTIIAMMTEDDWETALAMRDTNREEATFIEATEEVNRLFNGDFSQGTLRLKESSYYRPEFQVTEFREALLELLSMH
jgi:hypothetical protein